MREVTNGVSPVKSNKKEVLILGGEPFLVPRTLLQYIRGIEGKGAVEKIFITTSLPKTVNITNPVVAEILTTITGLNVSLQHFDPVINNEVLQARSQHNRIQILKDIVSNSIWQEKVRVSINLVNGYVDTKENLESFLQLMQDIGVKQVKINELQHEEEQFVSFEKIMNVKLKSPFAFGCQTNLMLDDFPLLQVTLKRSCFRVNDSSNASLFDLLKILSPRTNPLGKIVPSNNHVLYENGVLKTEWATG